MATFRRIFAACVCVNFPRPVDVLADLFAISPQVIVRTWLQIHPGSAHSRWKCTNNSSTVKLLRQMLPHHRSNINSAFSSCVSDLPKIRFVFTHLIQYEWGDLGNASDRSIMDSLCITCTLQVSTRKCEILNSDPIFPSKKDQNYSFQTQENTVQNTTTLIAFTTSRGQTCVLNEIFSFVFPEKTSDLSDVHFKSLNPPQHPSVCANWSSSPTCSVRGETVIKPSTTTPVHRAVCFVQWSCDPGVSHLLMSGPAVTCSWPRCWSPGRHPWSDWCDTNRRLRQLRHGSETPSPPAPIWEHKHRYWLKHTTFSENKQTNKHACVWSPHLFIRGSKASTVFR